MSRLLIPLVALLFLLQGACSSSGVGSECTNNQGCDDGLTCSAGACAKVEAAPEPDGMETPEEEVPTETPGTPDESGETAPEEPDPEDPPADLAGPLVLFDSPDAYEMITGTVELRFSVSDAAGVDADSVSASVEGIGPLALNTVAENTFSATIDISNFEDGLIFPLILIGADDLLGNHSEYARRFGVDNRISVVTALDGNQVSAGTEITVSCAVRRALAPISDIDTKVMVIPTVENLSLTSSGATFTPITSGSYQVYCSTVDGAATDIEGKTVQVEAAAPASVETLITDLEPSAGDRLPVECRAFDTYGNQIIGPQGLSLDVSDNVETQHLGGQLFSVTAYLVGTYDVACNLLGIVDAVPESIVVGPSVPKLSTTWVSVDGGMPASEVVVPPTQEVTVHCSSTDAYGNTVPNTTSHFSAVPADGQISAAYGVDFTAVGFSASKAGFIYAVCGVDGFNAEDDTPARVEITPGLPFTWNVDLSAQDCYWAGRRLPMEIDVYDYWGNWIADPPISVSTIPAGGVSEIGGRYELGSDGDYDINVSLDGDYHSGASINDYVTNVRVDSTPPVISITSPTRATFLDNGTFEDSSITIEGTITDDISALSSASLNGTSQSVANAPLSINLNQTQSSRWGMSVIEAQAEDECGNFGVVAQSYLRSPSYFPPRTSSQGDAAVPQGVAAQLNQSALDAKVKTLIEDVVATLDINSFLPEELSSGTACWFDACGYWVKRDGDLTHGPFALNELSIGDGSFGADINVENIELPVKVKGWATLFSLTISGTVRLSSASVVAAPQVSLNAGVVSVSIPDNQVTVSLTDVEVDVDWGLMSPIANLFNFDGIATGIANNFTNDIEATVEDQIQELLPPPLEEFLEDFQLSQSVDIPEPIDMSLELSSGIDHLIFTGPDNGNEGYGSLGLYTQVYPLSRGATIPDGDKGAIRRDGDRPGFSPSGYQFGAGLKDDLINQVLWALWYGGGLSIPNAEDLIGQDLGEIELSFEAKSPPVLMPGSNGHQIDIGIGDAYIDAVINIENFGSLAVSMYMSAIIGGSVTINPATNVLNIELDTDSSQIWIQIDQIAEPALQGNMSVVFTEVLKGIVPNILTTVFGSIPIPTFDVGGLAGLPQSEVWGLSGGSIDRDGNYYRLTGSLDSVD